MDPFEELERMALNATEDSLTSTTEEPSPTEIARWQLLFQYSYSDAADRIKQHRSDLARTRVSDEHWSLVQEEMEADGYDRGAYEHKLQLGGKMAELHGVPQASDNYHPETAATYIFKLEGPLRNLAAIQKGADLLRLPDVLSGVGEEGDAKFCVADGAMRSAIEDWLSQEHISHRPTFIRLSEAQKDLSDTSAYPTLGLDITLPHNRPHQDVEIFPAQTEYPVWYFFYGTLADPQVLSRVLGLPEDPVLEPASLTGGVVKT